MNRTVTWSKINQLHKCRIGENGLNGIVCGEKKRGEVLRNPFLVSCELAQGKSARDGASKPKRKVVAFIKVYSLE